ncbi:MAG: lysyltransferase [Paenibacillaceae bacterium]|nr:lysyltransferase [Paenibacillaceae bacterium]
MSETRMIARNRLKGLLMLYGPKALKVLVPAGVIALVFWEGKKELTSINLAVAIHLVDRLHVWQLGLLGLSGLLAVLMMSGYDLLFARQQASQGQGLPLGRVIRISWIANTFNNVMGFAGFTGVGLRLVLYKRAGASVQEVAKYLLFLSFAMITGLSVMCWLFLMGILPGAYLFEEHGWLRLAVWGMALYLPLYVVLSRFPRVFGRWVKSGNLPDTRLALLAVGASVLEWVSAGAMLVASASVAGLHIPASHLLGMFAVAAAAGIFSMAPGGFGAMDMVLLLSLNGYGVNPDRAMAALILFRVFYYLLPWTAGLFLAAVEWMPKREKLAEAGSELWEKSLGGWQRFWSWPGQSRLLGDIGIWALTALVLLSGSVLLLSAATPEIIGRMRSLHHFITPLTMKLSHQITVVVGFILIVLSWGIHLKLRRAYRLTVVLLVLGAFFSILKGLDFEEAILLSAVAVLLYISRGRFYRNHAAVQVRTLVFWFAISLVVAAGYYLVGDWTRPIPYHWLAPRHGHETLILREKELIRSGIVGLSAAWLFFSVWFWLRPKGPVLTPPGEEDLNKLSRLLERFPGTPLTHLVFLRDKCFFWGAKDEVLFYYARSRSTLVVLGDPVGNPDKFREALREFREFADAWVLTPVFYQISSRWMPLYHQAGFRFFKLGEEGFADLHTFQLTGKSKADLRTVRNRFEREGSAFEMLEGPIPAETMAELKAVSDSWLGKRAEKGFSLGWFNEDYIQRTSAAVVRSAEGQIMAFATFMPCYDNGVTASIDLMRFAPDAGKGAMDYMFLRLFEWSRDAGYKRFNLGMAPLSSVGDEPYSMREERAANLVYLHANYLYKFKGLRRFKEKFDPVWETRYLAYPQGAPLVKVMLHAAMLVNRKIVIKKK